jgi:hypothetical protein
MTTSPEELLVGAADALGDPDRDLCKGYMALGYRKEPDDPAKPGKVGEVYPWGKNWKVTALTPLGAICFAAQKPPSDSAVQEAYRILHRILRETDPRYPPETWADQEHVTKQEVVDILRKAAGW